ncbi:MAG TPA: RNA polymerase sigma factor [Polyangia bacterium]|nr:RNA polymerase sigma factor [Polyangia bacterium]
MRNETDDGPAPASGTYLAWLLAAQPDLHRLARTLTDSATDAADLVQATNLRALEKRSLFVRGAAGDLRRWMFRIMGNLSKDIWRRESRLIPSGWLEKVPAPQEPPPARWTALADEEISLAMNSLHPSLREAYRMYAVERFSYATISRQLQIPRATVATRIFRARARLRAKLTRGDRAAA